MKLFKRETYLNKIRGFYHADDIIKVITGVRRCGKSSLMETIADELMQEGIDFEQEETGDGSVSPFLSGKGDAEPSPVSSHL